MVGKKVLYKFPNDIGSKFMLLIDDLCVGPKMANYSNDHSSDTRPQKKNCSVSLHVITHLCHFMAQNSKIWGGVKKIGQLFDSSNILKNRHFSAQQMANW